MAVAMRDRVAGRSPTAGPAAATTSALGIGIAQGYATLGRIGFEGRFDYAAIGSVTNLAARLCAEAAPWQVLVTQRVPGGREPTWSVTIRSATWSLRGFSRPVRVFYVRGPGRQREVTS